jgi:hypothetical protein
LPRANLVPRIGPSLRRRRSVEPLRRNSLVVPSQKVEPRGNHGQCHGIVALLRKHSELELQILNGRGAAVVTESELEATARRLAAHPQALNAVLQTARALQRTPDAVSVREVANFGGSI